MKAVRPGVVPVALAMLVLCILAAGLALGACGTAASSPTATASPPPAAPASAPASAAATAASASPAAATAPDGTPMKTIGVIGGVSWVSSEQYYRQMNEAMRDRFGPNYSAPILMYSIPFGEFAKQEKQADKGDWAPLRATMADAGRRLGEGRADFIVIASNTMNSTADLVEKAAGVPVLRIQDAVGAAVKAKGLKRVALLGTSYTMEEGFYRDRLEQKYGLEVVTPDQAERDYINRIIFDELCAGEFTPQARARFVRTIERLAREEGAQGAILGCTEIPLLVKQKDVSVPVFDSTALHVAAAVRYSLGED
jgi:aspartate racemase